MAYSIVARPTGLGNRCIKPDARVGVPEYWIADPDEREVVRYVLKDEGYQEADRHGEDISFSHGSVSASVDLTAVWPS